MTQGLLPRKLRLLRAEQKLSLRQAAKLTGLAKETLSDLERGRRHPNDVTLAKIAEGYGISVEELFDLEEDPVAAPKVEAPPMPEPESKVSEGERRFSDIDASWRLLEWLNTEPSERLRKARSALEKMDKAIRRTVDHGAATLEYVEEIDEISALIGEALYRKFGLMAGFDDLSKNDAELAELHETTQSRFWELRASVDAAWKPAMDKYFGREDTRKRGNVTDIDTKERQHTDREQRLKELKDAVG